MSHSQQSRKIRNIGGAAVVLCTPVGGDGGVVCAAVFPGRPSSRAVSTAPMRLLIVCLTLSTEPRIDRGVRKRAETVGDAKADGVPVPGRELPQPQEHLFRRGVTLFEIELVTDSGEASGAVHREPFEDPNV